VFTRTFSLILASLLLILLAGLNILASRYFWYWQWWWFDLLMHSTGGLAIGLVVNALTWRNGEAVAWWKPLVLAATSALIIGLGWELFEFTLDRSARLAVVVKSMKTLQLGWYDTVTDLLLGVIGSIVGGLLTVVGQMSKNKLTQ